MPARWSFRIACWSCWGVSLERAGQGFPITETMVPDLWFDLPEKRQLAGILADHELAHADTELAFAGLAIFSGPVVLAASDRIHALVAARLAQNADQWAALYKTIPSGTMVSTTGLMADDQGRQWVALDSQLFISRWDLLLLD